MTYLVADAPDGLALDTSFPIGPDLAKRIASTPLNGRSVMGVAQYVSLGPESAQDINAERLRGILDAGLGLWLVQHVRYPGWQASAELGHQLGAAAKRNAVLAGYAEGAHLGLDLEGCASTGSPVVDFVNAWAEEMGGTYEPLLYVGYCAGLTAQELYWSLPIIRAYWSDAGPRVVSIRGFCVKQQPQTKHCGIDVDPDELRADELGGRLRWQIDPDAFARRFDPGPAPAA